MVAMMEKFQIFVGLIVIWLILTAWEPMAGILYVCVVLTLCAWGKLTSLISKPDNPDRRTHVRKQKAARR